MLVKCSRINIESRDSLRKVIIELSDLIMIYIIINISLVVIIIKSYINNIDCGSELLLPMPF